MGKNFRCAASAETAVNYQCYVSFNAHYSHKCKENGNTTPECQKSVWTVKGLPKGSYEVKIGIKDDNNKSLINLVANQVDVFNHIDCEKCDKVLKAKVTVNEGFIEISDDC